MTSIWIADGMSDGYRDMLLTRGLQHTEEICDRCVGFGTRLYGSTATWRGGLGGQAMTTDVCDGCWGSGNKERPWPSHAELTAMKRKQHDPDSSREDPTR